MADHERRVKCSTTSCTGCGSTWTDSRGQEGNGKVNFRWCYDSKRSSYQGKRVRVPTLGSLVHEFTAWG
jgi:hypothetical protein